MISSLINAEKSNKSSVDAIKIGISIVISIILCTAGVQLGKVSQEVKNAEIASGSSFNLYSTNLNEMRYVNDGSFFKHINQYEGLEDSVKSISLLLLSGSLNLHLLSRTSGDLAVDFYERDGYLTGMKHPMELSSLGAEDKEINQKSLSFLIEKYKQLPESALDLGVGLGGVFNKMSEHSELTLRDKLLRSIYVNHLIIENRDFFANLLREEFSLPLYVSNPGQYWSQNFKEKFGDEPEFLRDVYLKHEISQEKLKAFLEK